MSSSAAPLSLIHRLQLELGDQRKETKSLQAEIDHIRAPQSSSSHVIEHSDNESINIFEGDAETLFIWKADIRRSLLKKNLVGKEAFEWAWNHLDEVQKLLSKGLRFAAEANDSWDPELLMSFLDSVHRTPHHHEAAVNSLLEIKQYSEESLASFVDRFEWCIEDAGATSWPDTVRIAVLHRGLSPALQEFVYKWTKRPYSLLYSEYKLILPLDKNDRHITDALKETVAESVAGPVSTNTPSGQSKVPGRKPKKGKKSTKPTKPKNPYFSWLEQEGILDEVLGGKELPYRPTTGLAIVDRG